MSTTVDFQLCEQLATQLRQQGLHLVTAESCTGGLIAATCTDLAGSSDWFERGFVTYSNDAKTECLGVPESLLQQHGAVSAEVAQAMAKGALVHSHAQLSVAVTGIAGPSGGSADKPVGTVWFGFARQSPGQSAADVYSERCQFTGDRAAVRVATVNHALIQLLAFIQKPV